MLDILSLSIEEISNIMISLNQPSYRAEQMFYALHLGMDFDKINIPNSVKEYFKQNYITQDILQILQQKISNDGTTKFIYKLNDGNVVEGVLMQYNHGKTLCVSTQVGCRMGCKFCASGMDGLVRNLTSGEILAQVIYVNKLIGGTVQDRKITNLVLMGSGEPLDNYDNVTKFLRLVNHPKGINISQRNISISTCGLVDKIKSLAQENFEVNLCLSLHASNDSIRNQIMPISLRYKIQDVIDACKYYFKKTGRRFIIEYTMIKGINDSIECAKELVNLLKGLICHVNIINLNEVKEKPYKACTKSDVYKFVEYLNNHKLSATTRRTMGDDVDGACGQLRRNYIKNTNI